MSTSDHNELYEVLGITEEPFGIVHTKQLPGIMTYDINCFLNKGIKGGGL